MTTERNFAQAIDADAVIVGAGPVGLFQIFELGLLEVKAHIIDSLPYPGGQPIELYPDKPIYDIPAIPVCTGQELTDALLKQTEPFGATYHMGQEVTVVEKQADGRFYVETSKGTQFLTKTIFIAAGVGDINTYPGKKKLILSGFHECALAAFAAMDFIFPEKKVFLQYTTTSPKLHKVLGVESPNFD